MQFLPWIIVVFSVAAAVKCLLLWHSERRRYGNCQTAHHRLGRKLKDLEADLSYGKRSVVFSQSILAFG